ncbi:MAG: hypothetical protein KDE27_19450 [Planctomycetes bacterium]|nr:hypothetical protein [Planctomycetota bacterium]
MADDDFRLRDRRVAAVGGSRVTPENAEFCVALGRALAAVERLVVVSGGRAGSKGHASADEQMKNGFEAAIGEDRMRGRFQTLIPNGPHPELFRAGDVRKLKGRTTESRRFALVSHVDAILTVQGACGTPQMVDLAIALDKPALPLPFTGGRSLDKWTEYRPQIIERFRLTRHEIAFLEARKKPSRYRQAAQRIVAILQRALQPRCFVAMRFTRVDDPIFASIRAVLDSLGIMPVRTDELDRTGNILEMIRRGIESCECAIVDITGENPNVMYELGLLHALDKPTMILASDLQSLPFDIRTETVTRYRNADLAPLGIRIRRTLAVLVASDGP